jgi:hypothetical protein
MSAAELKVPNRFGLMASAISGRPLNVTAGPAGESAWTDGRSVFVDALSEGDEQFRQSCRAGISRRIWQLGSRNLAQDEMEAGCDSPVSLP